MKFKITNNNIPFNNNVLRDIIINQVERSVNMKAGVYARYSSNNQREESIDAQIRAIKEFAKKNEYTIVKTYIDEAKSATSDDRPQFLEMIADAKENLFDVVICHKLDRFSRNKYDSVFYKKILKENDVRLISVLEQLDDSPESVILESVLEGMSEYYSTNLAREVKKGLKENALSCKHTGGKPPFGYDVNKDKNYILNEHEAVAVSKIFNSIINNDTVGNIVKWLKNNNYTTKYGTAFTSSSINAIVRNEKYKGVYVYGKYIRKRKNGVKINELNDNPIVIKGGIPNIVSEDVWDMANIIYNGRQHKSGGQGKAKEVYLLSGIIKCGLCGGSMCGNKVTPSNRNTPRVTYKCTTRKAKGTCKAKDILRSQVEEMVIEELDKIISGSGIDYLIDNLIKELKEQYNTIPVEITEAKRKLRKAELNIDTMMTAIMDGLYTPTMKDKMIALENEKQNYIDKISFLEQRQDLIQIPTREYLIDVFRDDMDIKQKSPDDQQRIIKTYVQKVVVFPEYIEIYSYVDTTNGAESQLVVSTYRYENKINRKPVNYFINRIISIITK